MYVMLFVIIPIYLNKLQSHIQRGVHPYILAYAYIFIITCNSFRSCFFSVIRNLQIGGFHTEPVTHSFSR
jgi:hypothetical protein